MTHSVDGREKRHWNASDLEARVVRYRDLVPCFNAFVDSRTPGSDAKENFTIIGPGVSENPDQYVHIAEAHGFNIGGARQPPECVNSQHSHETAEVFVVHTGKWRFDFGEHGDDAQVTASPGDIVSFPVRAFRGFKNVGEETGFLWSVLGGNDPGRVLWAPHVFELARDYGLLLLENGALIDTAAGQAVPEGLKPMPVTSRDAIARLRVMRPEDESEIIARGDSAAAPGETCIIGQDAVLPAALGFRLSRLILGPEEATKNLAPDHVEVVFVQRGSIDVHCCSAIVTLDAGDTMTVPVGLARRYASREGAEVIVVRGTE